MLDAERSAGKTRPERRDATSDPIGRDSQERERPIEDRFFDPDLPIDSDWLADLESGSLFDPPSIREGSCGHRSLDVNRTLISDATRYARERGLPPEQMPRFKLIRGAVYAFGPNDRVLRLECSLYWENETGYAELIDDLLKPFITDDIPYTHYRTKVAED